MQRNVWRSVRHQSRREVQKTTHSVPVRRYTVSSPRFASASSLSRLATGSATVLLFAWAYASYSQPLQLDAQRPKLFAEDLKQVVPDQEIVKHNSPEDGWVVIDGIVWDVTDFIEMHPGGAELIIEHLGKNVSAIFNALHPEGTLRKVQDQMRQVGIAADDSSLEIVHVAENEDELLERRESLPDVDMVVNLQEFEDLAKFVLGEDSRAWRYFSSWSDDGASIRATAESFSFLRFLPRVNVPMAEIDSSTEFFGRKVFLPIFMAPTGQNRNGHPDGELNHLNAASVTGIPQGVSSGSSVHINEILRERKEIMKNGGGDAPVWWQLYIRANRRESEQHIREAVAGGAQAIMITVDVVALGKREADAKVKQPGKGKKKDRGLASANHNLWDANLSWADIAWVQRHAGPGIPVLVKGITSPADVELAKKHGAAGVILSNHGMSLSPPDGTPDLTLAMHGRQLDGAPPPISTLVRLRKEKPELLDDPSFEVYIDGGVRRGTDVLKALCLGAKGVALGRAIIYAQTCYGSEGILRAIDIMKEEIHTGMKLLGAKTVKDLKPEMVELLPGLVGEQLNSGKVQ